MRSSHDPRMSLPEDLKNYRPSEDAFQIIEPDLAIFLLCVGGFVGYVMGLFL